MYFLHKAYYSFIILRNSRKTSVVCLGDILNSKITKKKYINEKNLALNSPQKIPCLKTC